MVKGRVPGVFAAAIVLVIIASAVAPAMAGGEAGPWFGPGTMGQGLNLTAINGSVQGGSPPARVAPVPAPVTLLHLELNETSLPGPRYMAFGPSMIDISVPPALFGLLLLSGLLAVEAVAARYLLGREGKNG
ncbi:MAG TPA: hypothetical protein VMB35_06100 [Methanomicrobiales archaeon]|nr:hypothetical protein [Methanomicrobiales archaeon]